MRTMIISAFPGTGKTEFFKKNKGRVLDSDSSEFSWIEKDGEKVRNPDFPINYLEHIVNNVGFYDYILVSSHKEVRDLLLNNCIFFHLIFPPASKKEEYIERYRQRGSSESFIELLSNNFEDWVNKCSHHSYGCNIVEMHNDYLEDEILLLRLKDNAINALTDLYDVVPKDV